MTLAQLAPVWPDREATLQNVVDTLQQSAAHYLEEILAGCHGNDRSSSENIFLANGGSCLSAPNAEWIIEPKIE
ncbi:MAG: hypothetical protein AB8B57_07345 [Congregibacter sp.]